MSSYDPKYEEYHKEIKNLHDTLKKERRDIHERDISKTKKERQRGGNTPPRRDTSPRRGHTETSTERYHRNEKEKQKKKERQKELEREQHRARKLDKLDKIHQEMVKDEEREPAEAPNEEDPLLKKSQMANMYDLLTQLHQCA